VNSRVRLLATLLIVSILVIIGAIILTFYWEDIFIGQNEEMDIPLQVARDEVIKDIESFKMRKLVRENRGLILRRENFTQISDYQKYVTPNNQIVQSYITTNSITSIKQAYTTAVNWIWVSDSVLHNKQDAHKQNAIWKILDNTNARNELKEYFIHLRRVFTPNTCKKMLMLPR